MNDYQSKSPVLFIIFNRVDTSLKVLEQIRCARPSRLYITADGPRANRENEIQLCADTRTAVMQMIDWECEVKTLFRSENLGPKEAITGALDWFFTQEEEGIILEHDCLPSASFFKFCDTLLDIYRNDARIWMISGCNFQNGKKWGTASYYFSNLTSGWGWATWKRSWRTYDKDLKKYESSEVREQLQKIFHHPLIVDSWVEIFDLTKTNKIDTWDYQVTFEHLFSHAINIVPNYNLVSNIGFGELAENTTNANSVFASVPLEEITEITHPKYFVPENKADLHILMEELFIENKIQALKKHNSFRRRFKRWLKGLFGRPAPVKERD